MGKIANRQSLAILDRGLKSQLFLQFCCIRMFKNESQIARFESQFQIAGTPAIRIARF